MWRTRGHDAVVELLKTSLAQGRVSHAYLLTGPDHVGKSTLARELAMALNCTAWQGEPAGGLFAGMEDQTAEPGPCYECSACRKAVAGSFPDLQVFDQWTTESGRGIVDQIRAIQYAAGLLPFEGKRKVYLLLNAADLTLPAQNALLKTLEEPASTVCMILTAATTQALLPTVVSRCQQLQLRTPPAEAIEAALVERDVDAERAAALAALSSGRIGWALRAAEEPELLTWRESSLALLGQVFGATTPVRFKIAEKLAATPPGDIDDVLQLWLAWLRDVLLIVEGCRDRVVNTDQIEELDATAASMDSRGAQAAVRAVQRARWQVDSAINSRMALEVLMLRLPVISGATARAN